LTLPPSLDGMRLQPRWVLWRYYTTDDGKRRKLPYDLDQVPGLGSIENPRVVRYGTLADVVALWHRSPNAFAGVGYAPDISDPFACLDFDGLHHTSPSALNLWNGCRATTYAEFSPSGNGGHAMVTLDPEAKKRLRGIRNIIPGMELYSDSGFFTVTGRALNAVPIANYSDRLWNLADKLDLHPKAEGATTVPTLIGRTVAPIEVGRIYEKIGRWPNAQLFLDMRDDWLATSTWAPRSKSHGGPDRSALMIKFVSFLVRAGARDHDLLWVIIRDSAVWRDGYSTRDNAEATLWSSIVPLVFEKQPEPPKGDGQPVLPSFMKAAL
jgi:hypothetical protein